MLGIVDADTTLKLDKPELRVQIDRERAADLGVDTEDIAAALRLMVGGDQEVSRFRDPGSQRGLRRAAAAAWTSDRRRSASTISRALRARAAGAAAWCGSTIWSRLEPGAQVASRIDRLDRQRQVSLRAGIAPGYRPGRPHRSAARGRLGEMNLPAGYTTRVSGRGPELERTFARVPLGVPAVDRSSCT